MIQTKPSDQFPTDEWLMAVFDTWFDPCPLNENPQHDGLVMDWPDRTFVNPPYSNPRPWVQKAIVESMKGNRVVMLLKMDSSTQWFRELQEAGAHFAWLNTRLHHGAKYPAPFPSMLAILTKHSHNQACVNIKETKK